MGVEAGGGAEVAVGATVRCGVDVGVGAAAGAAVEVGASVGAPVARGVGVAGEGPVGVPSGGRSRWNTGTISTPALVALSLTSSWRAASMICGSTGASLALWGSAE